MVSDIGEFSIRGDIADIYTLEENPVRIEFWGDTIDSIKYFNVDTQMTIDSVEEVVVIPATEFLCSKDVPFEDKFQKDLYKYTDVLNIGGYLDNCCVFFNKYDDIKKGYEILVDEIFNYNVSLEVPSDTKYMFDFDDIKNSCEKYFMTFDNSLGKNEQISYSSNDVDVFTGGVNKINESLDYYLTKGTVVVCLPDRYKVNKLIDDLGRDDIVFTDIDNLYKDKINVIVRNISKGFIYNGYVFISTLELYNKKNVNYN